MLPCCSFILRSSEIKLYLRIKSNVNPKICHTYPTMVKLGTVIPYPKKIQKIYESRNTPPRVLQTSAFFHQKSANFAILGNTDIDCILIYNFYLF